MKQSARKIIGIITISLFLISLVPLAASRFSKEGDLGVAIFQVQQLQAISDSPSEDFNETFTSLIQALQASAGINTVVAKTQSDSDSDTKQFIVSVRPAYLLESYHALDYDSLGRLLPGSQYQCFFKSHVKTPEIPPPIV